MKFNYATLETCSEATGLVIVVDVLRAFSNAAYAFSRGVEKIYPVGSIDEALTFKRENPGSLACGEVGGIPSAGFDFGNSPTEVLKLDLKGRTVVQRTGAGTQGIVKSIHATHMVAASLVVANATVNYVQKFAPGEITFVVTGRYDEISGDEDQACAEYLESLLRGRYPDPGPFIERIRKSRDAELFTGELKSHFPKTDINYCTNLDAFDFAMLVTKEDGRFVMRAIHP